MKFCIQCGKKLADDAKFCDGCGVKIVPEALKKESKKEQGKCPNCGSIVDSLVFKCPYCGASLEAGHNLGSAKLLMNKIQEIEGNRSKQGIFSFVKDKINDTDSINNQVAQLIKTFPIPSNKEDILDIIVLAESNLTDINSDSDITHAWRMKYYQALEKAEKLYKDDPIFKSYFDEEKENEKKVKESIEKSNKNEKLLALIGAVVLLLCGIIIPIVCLVGSNSENASDDPNAIVIGYSSDQLDGKNYLEVKQLLENKGFTNVQLFDLNDLITGWLTKDGEVEKVSIDGKESFSSKKQVSPDALIIIYYHSFPDGES